MREKMGRIISCNKRGKYMSYEVLSTQGLSTHPPLIFSPLAVTSPINRNINLMLLVGLFGAATFKHLHSNWKGNGKKGREIFW